MFAMVRLNDIQNSTFPIGQEADLFSVLTIVAVALYLTFLTFLTFLSLSMTLRSASNDYKSCPGVIIGVYFFPYVETSDGLRLVLVP
jgi:hypothetical protein